jgi:hypothetical protein
MENFLEGRVWQAPIRLRYFVVSRHAPDGKTLIMVREWTTDHHGVEIPGIPMRVFYYYVLDWPSAEFINAKPYGTATDDPLHFMETHVDAVCYGEAIRARLRASAEGAANDAVSPNPPTAPRPPTIIHDPANAPTPPP